MSQNDPAQLLHDMNKRISSFKEQARLCRDNAQELMQDIADYQEQLTKLEIELLKKQFPSL